jgi:PAS domain S-box-containing protein
MTGHYQPILVALSIVIAICTAYVALDLASRGKEATGSGWLGWISGAAAAMGGGIWSMHFIGMLALVMPRPVSYDLLITMVSLFLPIAMTGAGLAIAGSGRRSSRQVCIGGTLMGFGIAAMHYVGMAAMVMDAAIVYDAALVALSILIAVVASTASLWLAFTVASRRLRLASSIVMGMAVVGMHYVGMAAASFIPREAVQRPWFQTSPVEPYLLGSQIAAITGAVLLLGLISSTLARQKAERKAFEFERTAEQERSIARERLKENEERYRLAIQATGLGTWDWDLLSNDVVWSDRTKALLGLAEGGPVRYEAFLERVHPDDRDQTDARVRAALDPYGDGICLAEFRILLPDGEMRWLRSQGQTYFEGVGRERKAVRMLGTKLDITAFRNTEDRLRLSIAEKEMLLKEIHHRIKNNMQAISGIVMMESTQVQDPVAREGFEAVARRISAMARLHEHLYATRDLRQIDLGAYFRELGQSLAALHRGLPVTIEVEAGSLACDMDVAIPLGLIVNELATNSLKHAFPDGRQGMVRIRLFQEGDDVVTEVSDTGVGSEGQQKSLGLGKLIVTSLAQQLEADLITTREGRYCSTIRLPADRFVKLPNSLPLPAAMLGVESRGAPALRGVSSAGDRLPA